MSILTKTKWYWKFDSNSNDSLWTNNGTDTWTPSYATGWKIWNWVTYNGTSQYTTFPDSAIFKSTACTWAFWVKKISNPWSGVARFVNSTNFTWGIGSWFMTEISTAWVVSHYTWNWINATSVNWSTGYTLDTNIHFMCIDISWTTMTTYIDDMVTPVYTKTGTALWWSGSTNYPMIGANNFGWLWQYSNFLIDEMGIYDNLTQAERQELANWLSYPFSTFTPKIIIC